MQTSERWWNGDLHWCHDRICGRSSGTIAAAHNICSYFNVSRHFFVHQPRTLISTARYPDGSLQTYLTTATFGENGFPNPNGIVPGIIYTTGFTGLTTLTTTGVMTVMTYVTYPYVLSLSCLRLSLTCCSGGRVSSGLVSAFGVTTETISGVSAVSTAVYSTTSVSTTTGLINGQFSTSVVTSVGLATQTVPAFEINAASSNNNWLLEKVALLAGGMLLAWL